ncbi:MAG: ECF transporter S component [Anaerolineales bacterium]|uniref:ECF transporter S component n=1 Tax=Candidatus Villigracilis proximus TaxID=3140683 RepID=UPI003134A1F7|nr:ECF transporter S component [Anaerolineales bacterium]
MSTPVILGINLAILVALGAIAKTVKSDPTTKGGFNFNYTTSDLVIMAVLGALAGVINTWMGNIWYAANTVSPIYGAALQGTFMWAYVLAYFLVRKSGTMLIIGLIEATVEALLGNQAGLSTLGWGISQGIGAEVVMAFCMYSKFGWLALGLAGAGASQFGTVWSFILYGWTSLQDYLIAAPINMISGFIFSGLLGYYLGKMIEKTGLLRSTRRKEE